QRVLPPADLRLLLVRGRERALRHRPARPGQHPLRDRLPPPDEHVPGAGQRGGRSERVPGLLLRGPPRGDTAQDPARQRRPPLPRAMTATDEEFSHRDRCAIVGIGATEYSRDAGRSDLTLATQAALAAIEDAGLAPGDIDGI